MKKKQAERIVGYEVVIAHGGVTPLRDYILVSGTHPVYGYTVLASHRLEHIALSKFVKENYAQISQVVRREQNYRCMGCGRSAVPLEIDHIDMRSGPGGRIDARENLRALGIGAGLGGCGCHAARHEDRNWKPWFNSVDDLLKSVPVNQ